MSNTLKKDDIILEFKTENAPTPKLKIVEDNTTNNSNTYFYKVANHAELYKLGSSFLEDFKAGLKSFTIASTGYYNSQQKTLLALASFFDHYDDLKIAIISDNLFLGCFQEVISQSQERELPLPNSQYKLPFFSFHHHFDFIDLNIILDIPHKKDHVDYEQRVNDIVNFYDIIFWDMPELHKIQLDPKAYYSAIQAFDSLTIIASKSITKSEDIENIKTFFDSYGIGTKGLLFNPSIESEIQQEEKQKKKKAWWKIF